jgi:hypothetical protein
MNLNKPDPEGIFYAVVFFLLFSILVLSLLGSRSYPPEVRRRVAWGFYHGSGYDYRNSSEMGGD